MKWTPLACVLPLALAQVSSFLSSPDLSGVSCSSCLASVQTLNDSLLDESSLGSELLFVESMCGYIIDEAICQAVGDSLGYVGRVYIHERYLDPETECENIGLCPAASTPQETISDYESQMIQGRPADPEAAPRSAASLRILIVSDIHIDLNYAIGSAAQCDVPLCCRADLGPGAGVENTAGYWGALSNCDIPQRTIEAVLSAAAGLNPDIVLWLGDTSPHDLWNYSPENQSQNIRIVTGLIAQYFPGVPVYPVIGNHDCFPMEQFYPGNESQLLEDLADAWSIWLDESTLSQFRINGYYAVKDPQSGLNLIALNTQMADTSNFYLAVQTPDPGDMLQWLSTTLKDIESRGESAVLFGHIPPGDHFADSDWARMYQSIADRYRNTIKGHYYAHTHNPQFYVIQPVTEGEEPVGVILAAPSMTTYTGHPPAVRLMEVDAQGFELVDYTDYVFPLELANASGPTPQPLYPLYSAKTAYSLPDLSPSSWLSLSQQIQFNPQVFATYWRLFNYNLETPCDSNE